MSSQVHESAARARASQPNWPVLSGLLPPLPDAYIPRHETGLGLIGAMAPGETTIVIPSDEAAHSLGRLGGAGTTQLAAAAARALWDQGLLDLLVWVTASSRAGVVASYAQALADLGAPVPADGPEVAAAQFLARLADTERPWLVALDDLTDAAAMEGLWPQGPAGRVIVTTHQPEAAVRAPRPRSVPVGPFSRREALAYLTTKLHADPDQRLGALDLANDLGFFPIALALAAAVVADSDSDCRQFRARLAEHQRLQPPAGGHAWTVAASWGFAAELADQAPPAGLAAAALALAAVMDPNGIPGAVLTSRPSCAFFAQQRGVPAVEEAHVRAVLHNLARLGLVCVDTTSAARTVRMHAHIQAIVRQRIPAATLEAAAQAAADALLQVWPRRDAPPGFEQALRDCAARLHEVAGKVLWTRQCHPLLIQAGRSLDQAGLASAAVGYWQAILDIARRMLGPGHAQSVLARDQLAAAYEAAGLLEDAIAVYEHTLAERERSLGPGHPETLAACASLSRAYRAADRIDDAVRMAERAVGECERGLGPSHPDTIGARAELAQAYLAAGRLNEAITAFQHTVAAREQVYGPVHEQTMAARSSLAYAFRLAGQYKEAIGLFERSLLDRERTQGADHQDTLTARANLASAYRAAGRLKDAIPVYKRALAGRERAQGPDHPDTITARANLAFAYLDANKLKDAIPLFERALADRERAQGADHADTITARGNLASAYHSARKMPSAIPLYEQTLADCERVLGPGHPDTLASRGNLAHAYHLVGRLTESVAMFERTLSDCERVLGPDHPLTRTARENLAAATRS